MSPKTPANDAAAADGTANKDGKAEKGSPATGEFWLGQFRAQKLAQKPEWLYHSTPFR